MKKLLKNGFVAAVCAATMLAGFGTAHADGYNYIDLYEPAALASDYIYRARTTPQPNRAMGINDAGMVVGYLKGKFAINSGTHVLIWDLNSGGAATDLGVMGSSRKVAYAYGISENGQIAGGFWDRTSTTYWKSFTYDLDTGSQTNFVTDVSFPTSAALDVNDSGQAVGWVSARLTNYEDRAITAFISNADGTISCIPGAYVGTEYVSGAPGSSANAINNAGLVTGYTTVDDNFRAFLYDSSTETFTTLGTLGGLTSVGTAINENGTIVGYSTLADGAERAFLYSEGTMIDLGSMGDVASDAESSRAYGINDAGDVVGTADGHAFLYSDGRMIDLNSLIDPALGITLEVAYGINNKGQIVGYGTGVDYIDEWGRVFYYEHAFALTPTPVPASLLLFGSGLAGLGLFRRRKQA